MKYINEGVIEGVLTKEPIRVSKGVLSFQLEIVKEMWEAKYKTMYPSFVMYKEQIDEFEKIDIKIGNTLKVKYELETKRKLIDGRKEYHENRVVISVEKV